jgi:hypothetical protein
MMSQISGIDRRRPIGRAFRAALQILSIAAATCAVPASLEAQTWKVGNATIQTHGFFSQAYLKTDTNNFLSMDTSEGSGAFTDAGINVSSQATPKLRVGAQLYLRNVGQFGNWKPQLDWGYVDYRFNPGIGLRAGKVKTVLGLYNDTQDVDFLHTWALLPLALYPVDLRGETISHVGGDVYGTVQLKTAGTVSYTSYGGYRPGDLEGGFAYGLRAVSSNTKTSTVVNSYKGYAWGGDVRWNAAFAELFVGGSLFDQHMNADGTTTSAVTGATSPYVMRTKVDRTMAVYAEYQIARLRINGEYRRNNKVLDTNLDSTAGNSGDPRRWFASAAYRIARWVEVGAYRSVFIRDVAQDYSLPTMHIYDNVATARFDLAHYWSVKVEGHFMDGYGGSKSNLGFYKANNPQGRVGRTNMLMVRTGVNF